MSFPLDIIPMMQRVTEAREALEAQGHARWQQIDTTNAKQQHLQLQDTNEQGSDGQDVQAQDVILLKEGKLRNRLRRKLKFTGTPIFEPATSPAPPIATDEHEFESLSSIKRRISVSVTHSPLTIKTNTDTNTNPYHQLCSYQYPPYYQQYRAPWDQYQGNEWQHPEEEEEELTALPQIPSEMMIRNVVRVEGGKKLVKKTKGLGLKG